jgi:HK97 family phage prohead protease
VPTLIDKHARRERIASNSKLTAKAIAEKPAATDSGFIEGYAAVWGNVDLMGEIMQRGSCARSIAQAVPAGNIKLMVRHYRDGGDALECIGTITKAVEDDYGLWIHAELDPEPIAQEIRAKVVRKEVKFLSIGFFSLQYETRNMLPEEETNVLPWRKGQSVTIHTEVKVIEVTVTVKPVNDQAVITNAKTIPASSVAATGTGEQAKATDANALGETGKTVPATAPASEPPPAKPPVSPGLKRDLALKRERMSALEL